MLVLGVECALTVTRIAAATRTATVLRLPVGRAKKKIDEHGCARDGEDGGTYKGASQHNTKAGFTSGDSEAARCNGEHPRLST
jgi:hypothetical protein